MITEREAEEAMTLGMEISSVISERDRLQLELDRMVDLYSEEHRRRCEAEELRDHWRSCCAMDHERRLDRIRMSRDHIDLSTVSDPVLAAVRRIFGLADVIRPGESYAYRLGATQSAVEHAIKGMSGRDAAMTVARIHTYCAGEEERAEKMRQERGDKERQDDE